jgi:CHAT domain-containing protein/Tfp pilus assembly protein PilF
MRRRFFSRSAVRPSLTALLLGSALCGACGPSLTPLEPLPALQPLPMTGHGRATVELPVPADEYVAVQVRGRAIDVQVAIGGEEPPARLDAPGRATGLEILLIEPGPARPVTLTIEGNDYATVDGEVEIEAAVLPDATRGDRERIEATRLEMSAATIDDGSDHANALTDAQRLEAAGSAWRRLGDDAAVARTELARAWILGWRVWDYEAAIDAAEAALETATTARSQLLQAHARMWLGAARTSLAQGLGRADAERAQALFAAAGEALQAAADAYETLGLAGLAALAVNYRGVAEHYAGDWSAAEATYQEASDRWLAIDDTGHQTLALQSLALLWHERGEPRKAIDYFDQALAQRDAVPPSDYAYMLYNSALPHYVLGLFDEAIERYYAAMQILREAGDRPGEARALQGIGTVLNAAGEPERAREVLEQVVEMRPAGSDDRARVYALLLLGEIELDLGRIDRAIELHEEALTLAASPNDEIRARVALAIDLNRAARDRDAEIHLEAALALPLPETHRGRARAWRELGVVAASLGREEASEAAFREALSLYERTGAELERAYVLEARAGVAFEAGRFEQAASDASEALEILGRTSAFGIHASQRAVFLASRRSTLGLEIDALVELAGDARDRGEPNEAAALERRAFEASDRHRSVLLLDAIAAERRDVPRELLERQRDLLEQLAGKRARQDALLERAEQDDVAIGDLGRDIVQVRSELDAIAARIGAFDRAGDPTVTAHGQARLQPPAGTAVAEYFLGNRRSWLFLLAGDALSVHELPSRNAIDAAARQLHSAWSSLSDDAAAATASAIALREMLLSPIEQQIDSERLWVVPDGSLNLVPLTALAALTGSPLADRRLVAIPSLLAATVARPRTTPAPHLLAMIADPVYGADDPRFAEATRGTLAANSAAATGRSAATGSRELERLPAAAVEARDVLALIPRSHPLALTGFDARRDRVFSAALGDYRIVHFATHAWADSRDPALATLALSTVDASGAPIDGLLRAADIAALELHSDLVVLSGCETALGRAIDGEGLLGLSNAFLRAGASSVVASLWRVPDTSSAYLMRAFYRALVDDGASIEEALRTAQSKVRSQPRWADPYFWAGFEVVSVTPGTTAPESAWSIANDSSQL